MNGELALFTDTSNQSREALQQRRNKCWKSLAFFSKKLSKAETKYSAFDREMLAIYLAIKHFRHMLEARTFVIYTDHKPLTFAFRLKPEKSSPRQFHHLDFISQFTTDIRIGWRKYYSRCIIQNWRSTISYKLFNIGNSTRNWWRIKEI